MNKKSKPLQNIYFEYPEKILNQFYIVLAKPKLSQNVGSVARAMLNMGFQNLIIAGSEDIINRDARTLARSAGAVLDRAEVRKNLGEALSEMNYTVGTTRRPAKYEYDILTPDEIVPELIEIAKNNRVAILFGPEDTGLHMDDLVFCNTLLRIPTSSLYPSINLSQSVLIICWEIFKRVTTSGVTGKKVKEKPKSEVVEGLFQHLEELFREIDYLHHNSDRHTMQLFRQIFRSSDLDDYDIGLLRSVLHKTQYYINQLKPH